MNRIKALLLLVALLWVTPAAADDFTVVNQTIVKHWTANDDGFRLQNLRLRSGITDGVSPVVRLYVDQPGINVVNWLVQNVVIQGSGREGNCIEIVAALNTSWIYAGAMRDVETSGCGKAGVLIDGSVFEFSTFNLFSHDNVGDGIVLQHDGGGQVSAVDMYGARLRNNGGFGAQQLNGARDIKWHGGYFVGNHGGLNANQGDTLLEGTGFENNVGVAIQFQNYLNLVACTFSTGGAQATQIAGTLAGWMTIVGPDYEDYGGWTSRFLSVNGSGTIVIPDRNAAWAGGNLGTVNGPTLKWGM